jgi:hypothetical protein
MAEQRQEDSEKTEHLVRIAVPAAENEKEPKSMYTKIYLPYMVGVNTIYSKETLLKVSVSANSQKE